jgi:hypothetical protein
MAANAAYKSNKTKKAPLSSGAFLMAADLIARLMPAM